MTEPQQKLASSLQRLADLQAAGRVAIRSKELTRTDRERLVANGFLLEVMRGWYIPSRPDQRPGDTTAWFAAFWHFCAEYLRARFGEDWSLSPEQSLLLHAGNRTVPEQLVVRSPKARNQTTNLPHGVSLLEVRAQLPDPAERRDSDGLLVFSAPSALVAASPVVFAAHPTDVRAVLSMVAEPTELQRHLLDGGHSVVAGRLAGALRSIGRDRLADSIRSTMDLAGYAVREHDPFDATSRWTLPRRAVSPHAVRIRLLWQALRDGVIANFPNPRRRSMAAKRYLARVDEAYVADAYHSLSIEGYRVSAELIERVREGAWRPERDPRDRELDDALAARGYWQAFRAVKRSVEQVLGHENPGVVAERDHGEWYRQMFAPRVTAGLVPPTGLAGYRDSQVFIQGSRHVPMEALAVRDAMPVLFEMLEQETEASVRAVLGHFVFVYVHPYLDGNGRLGRFLMNVMLASGGYPWTVVPVEQRTAYLSALEVASVRHDIVPLASFLGALVAKSRGAQERT